MPSNGSANIFSIILAVILVIIVFVAVYYMWRFNQNLGVGNILNAAVDKSKFNPTTFHIYDRSTPNICDRLIIVQPFEWILWAINDSLYILNPEAGIKCSPNSVSAIQVDGKQFVETCLKLNLNSILQHYQRGRTPHIIDYTIETPTFTILSAINLLVRNYITFKVNDNISNVKPLPAAVAAAAAQSSSSSLKHTHYSKMNGFTTIALQQLSAASKSKGSRKLDGVSVVKLVCATNKHHKYNNGPGHNTLIDTYRKHMPYKLPPETSDSHGSASSNNSSSSSSCSFFVPEPLTIEEIHS